MAQAEYQKDLDSIREDMAALRKDLGDLVHSVAQMGKQRVGDAREKARDELDRRIEQLSRAYHAARDEGTHAAQSAQRCVEDHPLSSIAVSFGVGLIVGKILSNGK